MTSAFSRAARGDAIGLKAGTAPCKPVSGKRVMAKYFQRAIAYTSFEFTRVEYGIANDASLNRCHEAICVRL
jgi:hypothetical protein